MITPECKGKHVRKKGNCRQSNFGFMLNFDVSNSHSRFPYRIQHPHSVRQIGEILMCYSSFPGHKLNSYRIRRIRCDEESFSFVLNYTMCVITCTDNR